VLGGSLAASGPEPTEGDQEFADRVIRLEGVAEPTVGVDGIPVPAAFAGAADVSATDEVGDDRLGSTLSYPNALGNVAAANIRLLGDARENLGMVRQKRPVRLRNHTRTSPLPNDGQQLVHHKSHNNVE
jgi:hypothetical protein